MMLLYIDPGTGSALFSIVIGLLTTVYFVGRAVLIKCKVLFTGKKTTMDMDVHDYVVYCEGPQYVNVFLPVLESFEKCKTEVIYLTSVKEDPVFSSGYEYIKAEYIGEGNTAIGRLNFLKANICLMTTPGLGVYQLKRSKGVKHYSHVLHMVRDATVYRLFGLDYFDSVLLSGDYQAKDIRMLEAMRNITQKELVTVGCPYLDVFAKNLQVLRTSTKKIDDFTVLVSPTWGKSGLLSLYGEKLLDPLVKSGFNIIIRPHPQSKKAEPEILENLEKKYENVKNISWDYDKDNSASLIKSDIMISDLSGIIFDYVFLYNKPLIYLSDEFDLRPYDAWDLTQLNPPVKLWQLDVLPKIGKKITESDFNNIKGIIIDLSISAESEKGRLDAKNTAWMYQGKAGENIVDFMVNTVNKIKINGD